MTAVITAIFGGYDNLPAPAAQTHSADWVCFTDEPFDAPPPWRIVFADPPDLHPRDKTIAVKLNPWRWVDDPTVIWIDANSHIYSPHFVDHATWTAPSGFATYRHPDRDCIYEEAKASLDLQPVKYAGQPILEQVQNYREQGHPEHWGLYAVGTYVAHRSLPVADLFDAWRGECEQWTYQTQLSLPHVARVLGFTPDVFDHSQVHRNPWMRIGVHNSNR